jgi:hypothetical protein
MEKPAMIKFVLILTILIQAAMVAPGYAFFDYLFSGRSSRDAIDNSAIGDIRAWWTGNPMYQFNPWYSPQPNVGNPQGQQQGAFPGGGAPQAQAPQYPQPAVNYYPPQQGVPGGYGQIVPQGAQPGYGAPVAQQYQQMMPQQGAQQYQMPPQTYQQPVQQTYQYNPQQGYQGAPGAYQMQQPGPQGYQGMIPGGQ